MIHVLMWREERGWRNEEIVEVEKGREEGDGKKGREGVEERGKRWRMERKEGDRKKMQKRWKKEGKEWVERRGKRRGGGKGEEK